MADISKMKLLDGVTYNLKDLGAIQMPSGGSVGNVLKKTSGGVEWGEGGSGGDGKHVFLTQAEYDALPTKDPDTIYFITDSNDYNADKTDVTLYAANWSDAVYTITDEHIGTDTVQLIIPKEGITDTQLEALQGANIQSYGQDEGHLYLKAYGDVPEIDIPVSVIFHPGVQVRELEQSNVYSTNETVVGTWIDGKPIYRKVLSWTGSIANEAKTAHGISNLGQVIRYWGYTSNNDGYYVSIPQVFNSLNYMLSINTIDSTDIWWVAGQYMQFTNVPIVIVLEYTKTTD